MIRSYDSYVYIDLTALRGDSDDEERASNADAASSCAGRVLLVLTGRGMELVCVPTLLN